MFMSMTSINILDFIAFAEDFKIKTFSTHSNRIQIKFKWLRANEYLISDKLCIPFFLKNMVVNGILLKTLD